MGQQGGKSGGDLEQQKEQALQQLWHADKLIGNPEQLEKECAYHFDRAGLDAQGNMRRVELRRLLWTYSNSLGSRDLTWQAIEAAAVVGTVEPGVPVVSREEFFRCVTKTVHLVSAELRQRVVAINAALKPVPQPPSPEPCQPVNVEPTISATRETLHFDICNEQPPRSEQAPRIEQPPSIEKPPSSHPPVHEHINAQAQNIDEPDAMSDYDDYSSAGDSEDAEPLQPQIEASFVEPQKEPLFTPAPGGSPDELAPVNGMLALLLTHDGAFEPQRICINDSQLVLTEPEGPGFMDRLFGNSGRSTYDLLLLQSVVTGDEILKTPAASLLPSFAIRNKESLNRLLVLIFDAGEAICFWFSTEGDCSHCYQALLEEAELG